MKGAVVPSLVLISASLTLAAPPANHGLASPPTNVRNANHIFNAIHSSMRQWGSSYYHNGMSYFTASVPKGTQFYHGTSKQDPVTGMEWLAFEPEHALVFARSRGGPPGGGAGGGPPKDGDGKDSKQRPSFLGRPFGGNQHVLDDDDERPEPPKGPPGGGGEPGWLHTYSTKRDLNLLYIDGLSAGKTENGTLDSQDYVLLEDGPHQGFWEYERAKGLCEMSQKEWKGRVDGILRMEMGFEIILCDFKKNLDVVRITRASNQQRGGHGGPDGDFGDMFSYLRSIAARYQDIGAHRVRVNYDNFVTAYAYSDIDLFESSATMPRLNNAKKEDRASIKKDIDAMILQKPNPFTHQGHDWRSSADFLVARFAARLQYLVSPEITSDLELLHRELDRAVRPFIDYDARDSEAETARCASYSLPPTNAAAPSLALDVVTDIARTVCSTLLAALNATDTQAETAGNRGKVNIKDYLAYKLRDNADRAKIESATTSLNDLITYLGWTVWKECNGCKFDEVCFIPIWPMGSEEDHRNPQCTNSSGFEGKNGYWGHRGGPGRGRRPGDDKSGDGPEDGATPPPPPPF